MECGILFREKQIDEIPKDLRVMLPALEASVSGVPAFVLYPVPALTFSSNSTFHYSAFRACLYFRRVPWQYKFDWLQIL